MINLTLRQLRSVQAIHRHGTISGAARTLGLTSPAITLQIKQLEETLGLALFDRSSGGMRLKEAGACVLAAANVIDTALHDMEAEIEALKGLRRGRIRLGVVSTAKYFAPSVLAAFADEHPDVDVELTVGNKSRIFDELRDYSIDIALMGQPPRDLPVRASVFGEHPLVIVSRPDHRLASQHKIARNELLGERMIARERGSGTRRSLEVFTRDVPELLDDRLLELDSNETIKQSVMAGLGIALISAHTIATELDLGRLVVLDVVGTPIRRQWFVVTRADRTPTPAETAFWQFLLRRGERFLPVLPKS
ncbi:LysR family transcriptional regulator [Aureimonas fodinaquatilis]|uniref:HTH-type transcriptional regulator CbbR n=1 Tax=Aureimonas fodinaquatilis TaxID=2565783 RepID=A0A5B0E2U5_9HYPH|nr:LysR family transcriptional regulator [Aureimonas fodinaquatilis]KAA0972271.1 LysR family transcriptional regulator [Aureimonas fodinaquatilis]